MEFINSIFSWIIKQRIHQIELFVKYPHEVQADWLKKLLQTAKATEYGKRHDFAGIVTYKDFQDRVPIVNYEILKDDIERCLKGENNIFWPTEIKWFAKSSGTTAGKSKLIPVTKESLEECHFAAGRDMLSMYYNNNENSKLFLGRNMAIGGSHQINQYRADSYYGDLSAIIMENLPFWVEMRRTPSKSIALMSEWEEKIDKMARTTIEHNVASLSGVPSWTLLLLQEILKITGKKTINEVWPNIEVFFHGGVSFNPYRKQFEGLIPTSSMNYVEVYNASEGFFAIQDRLVADDMLLMLDYGIFYEFMPMAEYGKDHPHCLSLDEVEIGVNYALVISTNGGLWRYKIGDTIKFTSLNPYRIQISGRTKQYINVFGEELIVENAEQAMKAACEKTNAIITEYTAGPIYMEAGNSGAHEWIIEFAKQPADFQVFVETLDVALKSLNSDYEAKRYNNYILKMPVVTVAETGTFYEWMKHRGKLGGQNKVPRLNNTREYLESLHQFRQHA